jgi:hypothetical protein
MDYSAKRGRDTLGHWGQIFFLDNMLKGVNRWGLSERGKFSGKLCGPVCQEYFLPIVSSVDGLLILHRFLMVLICLSFLPSVEMTPSAVLQSSRVEIYEELAGRK